MIWFCKFDNKRSLFRACFNLTERMRRMQWQKEDFVVSDEKSKLDVDSIHQFLCTSYWAKDRSKETVITSVEQSFTLGLFYKERQIGFARAITDYCTFAYLCDVYVAEEFRKNGLGHFLMDCLFKHPGLSSVKWLLKTTNAQSLYQDFGFKDIESAFGWMMRK